MWSKIQTDITVYLNSFGGVVNRQVWGDMRYDEIVRFSLVTFLGEKFHNKFYSPQLRTAILAESSFSTGQNLFDLAWIWTYSSMCVGRIFYLCPLRNTTTIKDFSWTSTYCLFYQTQSGLVPGLCLFGFAWLGYPPLLFERLITTDRITVQI